MNKVTFEGDGLYIDGVRMKYVTNYELSGDAEENTVLKLELIVDDSELFKKEKR